LLLLCKCLAFSLLPPPHPCLLLLLNLSVSQESAVWSCKRAGGARVRGKLARRSGRGRVRLQSRGADARRAYGPPRSSQASEAGPGPPWGRPAWCLEGRGQGHDMCLALGEVQRGAGGPTPVDQEERAGHGNNGEVTPEGKEEGRELSGPPPGVPGTPLPCSLGVLAPSSSQLSEGHIHCDRGSGWAFDPHLHRSLSPAALKTHGLLLPWASRNPSVYQRLAG